jgi:hypothetical protein
LRYDVKGIEIVEISGPHPMTQPNDGFSFLPGVPATYVLERLARADGQEVSSGKLASPESSAALAVNTFGWFHDRPDRLPHFAMLGQNISCPTVVEVEYCARFPWSGGRHPWLDAFVETPEAIIGIESKRFEPYRGPKDVELSDAYNRPVWGDHMAPYEQVRDKLRSRAEHFDFLDAAQLVKHAFGLVTEGHRKAKRPYLVYLFAEPTEYAGHPIDDAKKQAHRSEIARFAAAVKGAEVGFGAISYREWLDSWPDSDSELAGHRAEILAQFQP